MKRCSRSSLGKCKLKPQRETAVASCSVMFDSLQHHRLCLPGSSVHGILQARTLEWIAIPFSRGSSWPMEVMRIRRSQVRTFSGRSLSALKWFADSFATIATSANQWWNRILCDWNKHNYKYHAHTHTEAYDGKITKIQKNLFYVF